MSRSKTIFVTIINNCVQVMGASYFALMMASSLLIRKPHPSFIPDGMQASSSASSSTAVTPAVVQDVSLEDAMKAPQFHLLGLTFFCLATGGMGMFSVAKPMMSEVFSTMLPTVVTSAFAAKFVLMLSAGNLGEKKTVLLFCIFSSML